MAIPKPESTPPAWAQPLLQGQQPKPSDGKVDAYERVVNGKVVKVQAYGKEATTSTEAALKVRLLPGRPRIKATPGTYASGRDLPGVKAKAKPPEPMPLPFGKGNDGKQPPGPAVPR